MNFNFNFFEKPKKAMESIIDNMSPSTIKLLVLSGLLSLGIDSNAAGPSALSDLEIQNKSKETYTQNKNNEQLLLTYARQLNTIKQHGDTTWKSFTDPTGNQKVTIEYINSNPSEITITKIVNYKPGEKCEISLSDKITRDERDGTNYFDGITDHYSITKDNSTIKDISFVGRHLKESDNEQRFFVIDNKTKKYLEGPNVSVEYIAAHENLTESLVELGNSVTSMGETAQAGQ